MTAWLSKPAVLWAMDEAPGVPDRLVSTLIAVARYAGEDGRGSHPSAQTVADITRKSRRQARRDLDELEQLGLLLPGDQRIAKDIRADRRPFVYDLPMPRGVADDPPSSPSRGDTHVPPSASRGDTGGRTGGHRRSHGGTPMSPEEFLKSSGRHARAPGAGAARAVRGPAAPMPECSGCGRPHPGLRGADGNVLCRDCRDSYLATASVEHLRAEHLDAEAVGRGIRQPSEFGYAIAASP